MLKWAPNYFLRVQFNLQAITGFLFRLVFWESLSNSKDSQRTIKANDSTFYSHNLYLHYIYYSKNNRELLLPDPCPSREPQPSPASAGDPPALAAEWLTGSWCSGQVSGLNL